MERKKELKEMGDSGWELVQLVMYPSLDTFTAFFKKELEEESEEESEDYKVEFMQT